MQVQQPVQDMHLQQNSLDASFMQNGQSNVNNSAPYNNNQMSLDQSASNMMMVRIYILNMSGAQKATFREIKLCLFDKLFVVYVSPHSFSMSNL